MFSKETYRRRRAELQGRIDGGLLLFLGNGESPMNYADNCFPFRQDSSSWAAWLMTTFWSIGSRGGNAISR